MKKSIIVLLMSLILMLSGCGSMDTYKYNSESNEEKEKLNYQEEKEDLNYVLDCGFIKNIQVEFNQKFPLYISGRYSGEYVITNIVPTFSYDDDIIFLLDTTVKCIEKASKTPPIFTLTYKWYDNNGNVHASYDEQLLIDDLKLEPGEQGVLNGSIRCDDIKLWDREGQKIQIYIDSHTNNLY